MNGVLGELIQKAFSKTDLGELELWPAELCTPKFCVSAFLSLAQPPGTQCVGGWVVEEGGGVGGEKHTNRHFCTSSSLGSHTNLSGGGAAVDTNPISYESKCFS